MVAAALFTATIPLAHPAPAAPHSVELEPYLRAQAVIHGQVNGQPGTFLFDTGMGVSNFSPAFMRKIGCRPWGRITGFRMTGERVDNAHCDGITVALGGRPFAVPVASALDVMTLIGPDAPPVDGTLALDAFAGEAITIVPRRSLIVETPASLAARIANARELPVRLVRDVEGIALTVSAGVQTAGGLAWMELDNGNGGSMVVANHIAPLLGLEVDRAAAPTSLTLANGIRVQAPARTRDLIMDGDIGAQVLNDWILTLDLAHGRAWLAPARGELPARGDPPRD